MKHTIRLNLIAGFIYDIKSSTREKAIEIAKKKAEKEYTEHGLDYYTFVEENESL